MDGGGRRLGPTDSFQGGGSEPSPGEFGAQGGCPLAGSSAGPVAAMSSSPRPPVLPLGASRTVRLPPRSALDPLAHHSQPDPPLLRPLSSHLSCLAAQVSTFCLVLSLETACRLSPASRVASQPDLGAASFLLVPLETFSSLHLFSDFCPTSSPSLSANGLAPRFSKKIEITKMTASYFRSPSAVLLSR